MGPSAGIAAGLVLVFLFAIVVVVVGVAGLLLKIGGAVIRGLFGSAGCAGEAAGWRKCPARDCGHENLPPARYCAQCGVPLKPEVGVRGRT